MPLFRTDGKATFKGHVFRGGDVHRAGGEDGERSDHPVTPLCNIRTSRGPFHRLDAEALEEGQLCKRCKKKLVIRVEV